MNANERRRQILEVLCERRFDTISNLMFEFSVSRATIKRDIQELTLSYPIYTTLGNGGGVHVVDGYRIGKEGRAAAIFADMGTGKTLITISTVGTLYEQERIHKMLVVCPKSIVGVWEEEFRKFADFRYALTVLDGTLDKKKSAFEYMNGTALQVIVVNYESCWRLEKEVAKWRPDIIVCDESSKIKNPQTAQSKALHRLGRISKYNIILTGTPTTGSPLDFFSQYKFLDESILGTSYYLFRNKYAILGGYQRHQVIGYQNLAKLMVDDWRSLLNG